MLQRLVNHPGRGYARADLGNGFGLTTYGDVGGFGVGAQPIGRSLGTVDYSLNPSWTCTSAIAASISLLPEAKVGLASTSICGGRFSPALSGFSGHPPRCHLCSYPLSSGDES